MRPLVCRNLALKTFNQTVADTVTAGPMGPFYVAGTI